MTRKETKSVTAGICENLDLLGAVYYLPREMEGSFSGKGAAFTGSDEALSDCDYVIAVGGDGSIIHAARAAVKYSKPILGVNAGRLAFMAGLESDELSLLSKLAKGEFDLDRRMLLKTSLKRGDETIEEDFALNECFIASEERQRMSSIDVALNGNVFADYLCDGLIFATPTGSTAYSLSAGGPVVDPELKSIIFTPVCPHSLTGRSVIFKIGDVISVRSKDGEKLYYSNDGSATSAIEPDMRIDISASPMTADFIRIKSENFMDILYRKLAQRR